MYILDSQERIDPRNTNRFRLSHGKLRGFRINGRAWTFSGTVCVDPPWDASEDLVEIARDKFMEAEGDRERPDGVEYLSVHCDISPLEEEAFKVIKQAGEGARGVLRVERAHAD